MEFENPNEIWDEERLAAGENMVFETIMGLRTKQLKTLIGDGDGACYILLDQNGEKVSIREGRVADMEFATSYLDEPYENGGVEGHHGVVGVPFTTIVKIKDLEVVDGTRTNGSLQTFIHNARRLSRFPNVSFITPKDICQSLTSVTRIQDGLQGTYSSKNMVVVSVLYTRLHTTTVFPATATSTATTLFGVTGALRLRAVREYLVEYVDRCLACSDNDLGMLDAVGVHLEEDAKFAYKVHHMLLRAGVLGGKTPRQIAGYMMPPPPLPQTPQPPKLEICMRFLGGIGNHDQAALLKEIQTRINLTLKY